MPLQIHISNCCAMWPAMIQKILHLGLITIARGGHTASAQITSYVLPTAKIIQSKFGSFPFYTRKLLARLFIHTNHIYLQIVYVSPSNFTTRTHFKSHKQVEFSFILNRVIRNILIHTKKYRQKYIHTIHFKKAWHVFIANKNSQW